MEHATTQFGFLSVLVFLVLSAFPNVSHGQGLANFQLLSTGTAGGFQVDTSQNSGAITVQSASTGSQTLDVVSRLLANLIKKMAMPPPTGFDDAWANEVTQANKAFLDAYTILIQQLAECAGVDNASMNEIMQGTAENVRLFTNIFAQLAELVKIKSQTGAIDVVRANALMQTVGQNNRSFTHTFAQLADLMSKTGGTVNAIAVIQAAHADIEAFTNVIKKLLYMPITPDDASISEIMQAGNVLIGAFTSLTKQVTYTPPPPPPPPPSPPKTDNAWAKAVLETNAVTTGAFTNLVKQIASSPEPCSGINNAWASAVRKTSGVATGAFTKLITQLLFPPSMPKDDNAIKQVSSQSIALFTNVIKQLAALVSGQSQTDAIDNAWASVITLTADAVAGTFGNLEVQLANMPPPSSEMYNVWASKVMHSSDVLTQAFTILIDELVLAQSTGMIKEITPDQASAIVQSTGQSTGTFTKLMKLYVQPDSPQETFRIQRTSSAAKITIG